MKHTELPWYFKERKDHNGLGYISITHREGDTNPKWDTARCWDIEDAAFIVRACNNHYKLVEALKRLLQASGHTGESDWLGEDEPWEDARLALAAAEEE